MKTSKIEFKDRTVEYEDTPEMHKAVFDRIIEYFKKYEHFSGEGIMQNDNCQIYAPDVMSDIADDIIKFKVRWNEKR